MSFIPNTTSDGASHAGKLVKLNGSGKIATGQLDGVATLSSSAPANIGATASAGSATDAARSDHVHSDSGLLLADGSRNCSGPLGIPVVKNGLYSTSAYTSNTTLDGSKLFARVDASSGAVTMSLPAATGSGKQQIVKKVDSSTNAVSVARDGTDTIDGATSVSLGVQWEAVTLIDAATGVWSRI